MQKTAHLQLNTWVPSDDVDLTEINENFTLLDADAQSKTTSVAQHKAALRTLALHTAHRALEMHHSNLLSGAADNLILCDFSKTNEWSEISGMEIDTTHLKNANGSYTGYTKTLSRTVVSETDWTVFDTFQAAATGNITAVSLPIFASGVQATKAALNFRIREGESVVAEYNGCYPGHLPSFSSCGVTVGHTYTLEATSIDLSNQITLSGALCVTISANSAAEGYVKTTAASANGSTLYVWLACTGAAPTVHLEDEDGTLTQLSCTETQTQNNLLGTSMQRKEYCLQNVSCTQAKIKVTVTGQTSLYSICAIII